MMSVSRLLGLPGYHRFESARRCQASQYDHQGVFHEAVKDHGGNKGIEDTAENASQGNREVKGRRALGVGPHGRKSAVAGQSSGEKRQQVQWNPEQVREPRAQYHDQGNNQQRQQSRGNPRPSFRALSEGHDVCQQVDTHGHYPEQRYRREIGGDVGRHTQEPARGHKRQQEPLTDSP